MLLPQVLARFFYRAIGLSLVLVECDSFMGKMMGNGSSKLPWELADDVEENVDLGRWILLPKRVFNDML